MRQMLDLDTLAWIVGCLNPLSALLVGPALAGLLGHKNPATRMRILGWCQGAGWLILGVAQTAFLTFGWISGLGGFRWAQAAMIPVAAANFAAWWLARSTLRRVVQAMETGAAEQATDPVDAMLQAIQTAQSAGRVRVEHRTDIGPGIPTSRPEITATAIRLVPLDADGKPTGTPRHITGPVTLHLGDATVEGDQQAPRDPFPDDLDDDPHTEHQRYDLTYWSTTCATCWPRPCDTSRSQCRRARVDAIQALHNHNQRLGDAARQLVEGSTPVENPMEAQCRTPIFDASLSAPERCAGREGHEGDCAP